MYSSKLTDKVTYAKIREKHKLLIQRAIQRCKTLKWEWVRHIMRRKDNRWTRDVTEWVPTDGRRCKGKQHVKRRDDVVKIAAEARPIADVLVSRTS